MHEDGERITYGLFWKRVGAIAHALAKDHGVKHGDRVAICMRNLPEWMMAFCAITSIGAVAVPVNGLWTPDELEYGMADSGSCVCFADEPRLDKYAGIKNFPASIKAIIAVRSTDKAVAAAAAKLGKKCAIKSYESLVGPHQAAATPAPSKAIDKDDNAIIMYTSGTTNNPKGVILTHRSVLSALKVLGFLGEMGKRLVPPRPATAPKPATILTVPLFHATGSHALFLGSFLADGRKLVIMTKWNATEALKLVERERITTFTGVPTMAYELINHPEFGKYDTSSLEAVGGGGAPTPPKQVEQVSKKFKNAQPGQGYGLTETNAITCLNSAENYKLRPTSCGQPVINVAVKVVSVDDVTKEMPVGEPGELLIRGPSVMKGYWNKPEATREAITPDGWFRSGDLAKVDKDGFVYILDRVKQIIIRGGENISCSTVEAAVYELDGILEAAAIGVPDDRLGEEVGIAVVVRAGRTITLADIQQVCRGKIANYMIPTHLFVWHEPQLPRGGTGKIQKRDIIEHFALKKNNPPKKAKL